MILCFQGRYQHIVDVDFHSLPYLIREHHIYQPQVRRSGVLQTEGHDLVAIDPPGRHEGGLLLVFGMHEYLVIAGEGIQEAH